MSTSRRHVVPRRNSHAFRGLPERLAPLPVSMRLPIACCLLALFAFACSDAPEPAAEPAPPPDTLAFALLGQGQFARLDTTERVVRDAAAWQALRDSLRPAVPFDSVDFTEEMLLLVAVPAPGGGYTIEFQRIEQAEEGWQARYILAEPGADCLTAQAQAVPFQVVRLPRTDTPIHFDRRHELYRCTTMRSF
jgi:hypothetical protein